MKQHTAATKRRATSAHGDPFSAQAMDKSLAAPVPALKDKWKLLPHFQQLRGLVKQHIDSFDDFVNNQLRKIVVENSANNRVKSDVDENFFLRYTGVHVAKPTIDEDSYIKHATNPNECRLRDRTYAAPITVDVEYSCGNKIKIQNGVLVGKLPVMLRSSRCMLSAARRCRRGFSGEIKVYLLLLQHNFRRRAAEPI